MSDYVHEVIPTEEIQIKNRIRKDLGDIPGLANSIKENGLIEPIVLARVQEEDLVHTNLIAGERRLTAMKSLGYTTLTYGVHFIWREDLRSNDPKIRLLASSIEMEENIRRKELSWHEQILGKQKLLAIMQEIHGLPPKGGPTSGLSNPGFSVNKLAEMLGESAAQTNSDLELAAVITQLPILTKQDSREAAKRTLGLAVKIAGGQAPTAHVATPLHYKILIECTDEQHQRTLLGQLRGAGLTCTPVVS